MNPREVPFFPKNDAIHDRMTEYGLFSENPFMKNEYRKRYQKQGLFGHSVIVRFLGFRREGRLCPRRQ